MKLTTENQKFVYSEPVERALNFLESLDPNNKEQQRELENAIEQFNTALRIIEVDEKDIAGLNRKIGWCYGQMDKKDEEIAEILDELDKLKEECA